MKLSKIIMKNFKILFRSKSSAVVMILGPLILISLVGLAFNNNADFSVNVGFHAENNNELVQSYMSQIDGETYSITAFSNIDECIKRIKLSAIHACIDFPDDFEIRNNKTNEIKFLVDKSKINLVYSIIDTITKSFSKASTNLSMELTGDILSVVTNNRQGMIDAQNNIITLIEQEDALKAKSNELQRSLNTIVIDTKKTSTSTGNLEDLNKDLIRNIKNQRELSTTINAHFEELFNIIPSGAITDVNDSDTYDAKELIIGDEIYTESSTGTIFTTWNKTNANREELITTVTALTGSVTELLDDITTAKKTQDETSDELRTFINPKIDENIALSNQIKADLATMMYLIDSIDVIDAANIVKPITTTIETVAPEESHLGSLFPSLIILLIMMISILLAANLILMEKNSKAYFRNFTTPTSDWLFILSTYLTAMITVLFQITLVLTIAAIAFSAPVLQNFGSIATIIIISATLFIFIGMGIGYLFNSEETAMIGSIGVSSLFLLLSDMILPLESMPSYLLKIAKFNPFVLGSDTLRQVMLFNVEYESISGDIWIMIGFSFIILTLMVVIQQIMKLSYLSSFSKDKVKISKKTNVRDYFKINNHPVTDLESLIKVIRHMSDKDFKKHIKKKNNIIKRWLVEVLKNVDLAEKVGDKKKKEDIIFVLKRAITQEDAELPKPKQEDIKIDN